MSGFISLITDVLSISFTIGSVTLSLGQIAFAWIVVKGGISFYHNMTEVDAMDERAQRHGFSDYEEYAAFERYNQ